MGTAHWRGTEERNRMTSLRTTSTKNDMAGTNNIDLLYN